MRFVTYQCEQGLRPALAVSDSQILDLARAFDLGKSSGAVSAAQTTPDSIVALIDGGQDTLAACATLAALAEDDQLSDALVAVSDVELVAPKPCQSARRYRG